MKCLKEWVRPKFGKDTVFIFVVWQDEMVSINSGVPPIYTPRRSFHLRYPCISVHPPSLLNYILGGSEQASLEMHLEAEIKWTEWCTWRPWSIEFGDALGGSDRASLDMHWEAEMGWTERCTWRPWSIQFGHALGGRNRESLDMHLEAVIERIWTCTWRPRSRELSDALWGCDWSVYAVLGVTSWLWHGEMERDDLTLCS